MNKRQRIIQKFNGICQMCGKKTDSSVYKDAPELDHIVPRSMGGGNEESNLSLLCNSCNNKRSNLYGVNLTDSITRSLGNILESPIHQLLKYEVKNKTISEEQLKRLEIAVSDFAKTFNSQLRELQGEVNGNGQI